MNVLILGSGGREHALAWKASSSVRLKKLYCLPGSAAVAEIAECVPGDALDSAFVVSKARELKISLVIVGPEAPLAKGVADALLAAGIKVFGPRQNAARLESSKVFAKDFMKRHSIPTAEYGFFDDAAKADAFLSKRQGQAVVKADGLAAGKGVRVCDSSDEARAAVDDFMRKRTLGEAGSGVLIEERLEGNEATLMAFCDGKAFKPLPVSRDHKRLEDGDKGPNTGGMGAFAPLDVSPETLRVIQDEILDRTLEGFKKDALEYCGVLYFGLMLTSTGPKVLEFNVRFGDPETQVVLPLLESDLLDVVEACAEGKLSRADFSIRSGYAVSVVLASGGYPAASKIGQTITGIEAAQAFNPDGMIFHAGTSKSEGHWITSGGRVLNVVALGHTIDRARTLAYGMADRIRFEGMQLRRDIAGAAGRGVTTRMQPAAPRGGRQ